MKAIVQDSYGLPNVLHLRDIDRPLIGDDDVLVRVHAAGVDSGVWHLTAGLPYLVRLMGLGLRTPKRRVPGMDVAGRVEAVGRNVAHVGPGDEVFGACGPTGDGSFAEFASVPAGRLTPKPANITFEQAAAVPVSGVTALQGLRDKGRVLPGQKVLVIGAGGGVGTFAVQLAKAFGAEVTGVCGPTKTDLVRSLGADHVIDYTRENFADKGRGATTSSSTTPAGDRCRSCVAPSPLAGPSSSSAVKVETRGREGSAGRSCERRCCRSS